MYVQGNSSALLLELSVNTAENQQTSGFLFLMINNQMVAGFFRPNFNHLIKNRMKAKDTANSLFRCS